MHRRSFIKLVSLTKQCKKLEWQNMKVLMLLLLLLGLWEYAEGQTDCEQYISEYSGGILEESSSAHTLAPAEVALGFGAFGALTGLLLVVLVLIITGWVWTCWTMKKKEEENQHCKNCQKQESDSEEERFCLNQIYKMTTAQPVEGTAIEQQLEESGPQSINGLSSKDNKSYRGVNRVENFYSSSEGSNHSNFQEEQRENRVEEGESGEKHVYHILEKPGGDDYEELDKT